MSRIPSLVSLPLHPRTVPTGGPPGSTPLKRVSPTPGGGQKKKPKPSEKTPRPHPEPVPGESGHPKRQKKSSEAILDEKKKLLRDVTARLKAALETVDDGSVSPINPDFTTREARVPCCAPKSVHKESEGVDDV